MRTAKIEINKKEYLLCFSARVMRDCSERYGNAELGAWAAQTVLSREEAKKLLSFAKEQGFPDRERQRQWMLRLSGEFKSRAESVFEKAASEKRMVLSVSLAAGALVVVLFW